MTRSVRRSVGWSVVLSVRFSDASSWSKGICGKIPSINQHDHRKEKGVSKKLRKPGQEAVTADPVRPATVVWNRQVVQPLAGGLTEGGSGGRRPHPEPWGPPRGSAGQRTGPTWSARRTDHTTLKHSAHKKMKDKGPSSLIYIYYMKILHSKTWRAFSGIIYVDRFLTL